MIQCMANKYNYLFIKDKQIYGTDNPIAEVSYLDLSSDSWIAKKLSMFNVKTKEGQSIYELWTGLQEEVKEEITGFCEYIYILALNDEQIKLALSINAITDSKYNNIRVMRAILAINLLYKQRKIDYLRTPEKFLYWYWANCSYIVRWQDEFND